MTIPNQMGCLHAYFELGARAGVPPGVINVVTTAKNVSDVGREMCAHKTVKKVTFTGSTPVGKLLYGIAAGGMKKYAPCVMIMSNTDKLSIVRVSIEAGGNAPFIVFDDADIDAAVEGEWPQHHNMHPSL